ncbi:hypothetical protein EJ03DRAFT_83623 [Teratosphaeria nubilosa]|uniref:Nascent polypeptide-associated complex subunit alpha-like UBA domain-containing protein n=1 Tax=Teratosphaeria nubilosa TaxID=161662 RepID=A0A6G1LBR3_9PEZI|nr:hypothetical protein EJ03DRAFT_83623 [Teratosphaeria nubilosa]
MAEPQPADVREGADAPSSLPANATADDLKAASALSSLDARPDEDTPPKKEIDLKALHDAIKNLGGGEAGKKTTAAVKKEEVFKKPVVKVEQAHVTLLVEQLGLSKGKATELLRAHDADAVKAMTAWVTAAV